MPYALIPDIQDPGIVHHPSIRIGFPSDSHKIDFRKIPFQIDRTHQRLCRDTPVFYWKGREYAKTLIGCPLVLNGAAYIDVVISVAPVGRKALLKPRDALGEKEKG